MELDQIKQKVIEAGISEDAFLTKVNEYANMHPMFKVNKQLAYTVAASDLGVAVKTAGTRRAAISDDQIQDEGEYLEIGDIDKTELRVVNIHGYIIRAPQSQDDIKQNTKGNDVIYISMVDRSGGLLLSCYQEDMYEDFFDEKLQFMDTIAIKNAYVSIRKTDGARFVNINDRTSIEFKKPVGFGVADLHHTPVAEILDQYNTVLAVLSQIDKSSYIGCPKCRKGGFDVEAGDKAYCTSDDCKTEVETEELYIDNVGFMDKSGSIYCGLSRWKTFDIEDFEVGNMVFASVNSWERDGEVSFSVSAMKDISEEAYGKGVGIKIEEKYIPDPEDFAELVALFEFETTDEYKDLGPEGIDEILSVYREICEFYENVTPRDLSSIMTRRFREPVKIHAAIVEMLKMGVVKFDRTRKEISSLEKSN